MDSDKLIFKTGDTLDLPFTFTSQDVSVTFRSQGVVSYPVVNEKYRIGTVLYTVISVEGNQIKTQSNSSKPPAGEGVLIKVVGDNDEEIEYNLIETTYAVDLTDAIIRFAVKRNIDSTTYVIEPTVLTILVPELGLAEIPKSVLTLPKGNYIAEIEIISPIDGVSSSSTIPFIMNKGVIDTPYTPPEE